MFVFFFLFYDKILYFFILGDGEGGAVESEVLVERSVYC